MHDQILLYAESKMRGLLEQKGLLAQKVAAFREHYDAFREEMEMIQNEDKALERNFRKDIQEVASTVIDQDTLKILLQLYKVRKQGGKLSCLRWLHPVVFPFFPYTIRAALVALFINIILL